MDDFQNQKARLLFLSYAFTSEDKEHNLPERYRKNVLTGIERGEAKEGLEEQFMTGLVNCLKLSKKRGKEKIDESIVDEYFITGHHNLISECKAYEGKVVKVGKRTVRIETNQGIKTYNSLLKAGLSIGDDVKVHGRYVIR